MRRLASLGAAVVLSVCLCARFAGATEKQPFQIDGDFAEWTSEFDGYADGTYLYLRFTIPVALTLQGAPHPLRIFFDLDSSPTTGTEDWQAPEGLGPELLVTFSPQGALGGRGSGVRVQGPDVRVGGRSVTAHRLGLVFAPITEGSSFELRLKRPDLASLVRGESTGPQHISVAWQMDGPATTGGLQSKILRIDLPPRTGLSYLAKEIPARGAGRIRIVSWNVLFGKPMSQPEPFARIFRALDPDIILVQEWTDVTGNSLAAWFDTHLPTAGPWSALTSDGWGVGIVSRTPLQRIVPKRIRRPDAAPSDNFRPDRFLRIVAAHTTTPIGAIQVASLHLRCCGYGGSWQDQARIAEIAAIRGQLAAAFGRYEAIRIIGGDFNLVGTREPLVSLAQGLGHEGSDLRTAPTPLLGARANYTWRNSRSAFTPGRLDWLLYEAAVARAAGAFVLDTRQLTAEGLRRSGLEAADSDASDHLAVVLDVEKFRR